MAVTCLLGLYRYWTKWCTIDLCCRWHLEKSGSGRKSPLLHDGIAVKVEDIRRVFLSVEGVDKCWYLRGTAANLKHATTLLILPAGSPPVGTEKSPLRNVSMKDWHKERSRVRGETDGLLVAPVLENIPVDDESGVVKRVRNPLRAGCGPMDVIIIMLS